MQPSIDQLKQYAGAANFIPRFSTPVMQIQTVRNYYILYHQPETDQIVEKYVVTMLHKGRIYPLRAIHDADQARDLMMRIQHEQLEPDAVVSAGIQ